MKSIAVIPRRPNSLHLANQATPTLDEVSQGRGVLVRVLRVGLDGTDREINDGKYGKAPSGSDFLVLGHEGLGLVESVGPAVTGLVPGDYVVAMVRRPGSSPYDVIGMQDATTDETYYEHGISLLHGFLTEFYVDDAEYLIKLPVGLKDVGVLLEPTSIVEKGVTQAYEIQRRLRIWQPKRAAVLGAGTIGLLATMVLRNRGLNVTTLALSEPPYINSELVEALGARYVSTRNMPLEQASAQHGPFDIIFEATGYSPLAFQAMEVLGKNGVLVLSSVTGGDRKVEIPADSINLGFVLGNKVTVGTVSASREHFEAGIKDLALTQAQYPGWLSRLLTHPVGGLEQYRRAFDLLYEDDGVIKVFVELSTP